jgi:hypothetical protein
LPFKTDTFSKKFHEFCEEAELKAWLSAEKMNITHMPRNKSAVISEKIP